MTIAAWRGRAFRDAAGVIRFDWWRKRHRFFMTQRAFNQFAYPYFVTTVVQGRAWMFDEVGEARRLAGIIVHACQLKRFRLYAFCIMPDHVHLLVQKVGIENSRGLKSPRLDGIATPQSGLSRPRMMNKSSTLSDLMQSIKGNYSRTRHQGRFWQPRFNFRIVSTEQRFQNTIQYIRDNYRKQNLPARFGVYPYMFVDTY